MRLTLDTLWIKVSGICNLGCIGCRGEGRFTGQFTSLDEIWQMLLSPHPIREVNLTGNGEALLHPEIDEVVKLCREAHPNAMLWLISNGTIPVVGRVKEAIIDLDKIGLSIDGAMKETYEGIRIGANFDRFIENTRRIVSLVGTSHLKSAEFCFTASTINLHELVDVISLAHELGITEVWAQPIKANPELRVDDIVLNWIDPETRATLIGRAGTQAKKLGVGFTTSSDLYSGEYDIRKCRFLWKNPGQIQPVWNEYLILPCCWMSPSNLELIADRYSLRYPSIPLMDEVYNSEGYWRLREDLQNGDTLNICGNCSASRGYP